MVDRTRDYHQSQGGRSIMRVRSTGLGKTELICGIEGISRKEDFLIMSVRSTEPVAWHIRVALEYKDLLKLIVSCLKGSVMWFVLSGFTIRSPKVPEKY